MQGCLHQASRKDGCRKLLLSPNSNAGLADLNRFTCNCCPLLLVLGLDTEAMWHVSPRHWLSLVMETVCSTRRAETDSRGSAASQVHEQSCNQPADA